MQPILDLVSGNGSPTNKQAQAAPEGDGIQTARK